MAAGRASLLWFLGSCALAQAQPAADKRANIDHLLDALKAAPNEQAASMVEDQLQQAWLHAGTPAVTLLMSRGLRTLRRDMKNSTLVALTTLIVSKTKKIQAHATCQGCWSSGIEYSNRHHT